MDDTVERYNLKPCPFCGYKSPKIMREIHYKSGEMCRIKIFAFCPDWTDDIHKHGCGARSQAMISNGKLRDDEIKSIEEWAADLWNRRIE